MDACLNPPNIKVDCSSCLKRAHNQDELLVENEKLKTIVCNLESRLRTRENTTKLLMNTFQILQKRESEIRELKTKISSLENNESHIALKSKLQYVQSLNLSLQEELSRSASMNARLEDAKAEISRLTQSLSSNKRHTHANHLPLSQEDLPRRGIKRFLSGSHSNNRLQELDSMPFVSDALQPQDSVESTPRQGMPKVLIPASPMYENDLNYNLVLSDNDFSIFSEEMADVLSSMC